MGLVEVESKQTGGGERARRTGGGSSSSRAVAASSGQGGGEGGRRERLGWARLTEQACGRLLLAGVGMGEEENGGGQREREGPPGWCLLGSWGFWWTLHLALCSLQCVPGDFGAQQLS